MRTGLRSALAGAGLALTLALGACAHGGADTKAAAAASPVLTPPGGPQDPSKVLFWSHEDQINGYPHMESRFAVRIAHRGDHVAPLPKAKQELKLAWTYNGEPWDTETYLSRNHGVGLLVIKDGQIVLERYAEGQGPDTRWTSFSLAKSFSSTLVGAAIKDGYIKSVDDPVTNYLPGLKGSAYEGVTVRQLLQMTSGVKWNEDYGDPKSDVALFGKEPSVNGSDPVVAYMARLPREAEPGTKWVYKTGETNLVGSLVRAATHKTMADYLSEKIWKPVGMEQDAIWMVDTSGGEVAGCCLSATLKDYGRMAQFVLDGAKVKGKPIVPDGWFRDATTSSDVALKAMNGAGGYGYQWWTSPGGIFRGQGIFGQQMWINPAKRLIVISWSAWPGATDPASGKARTAMVQAVESHFAN